MIFLRTITDQQLQELKDHFESLCKGIDIEAETDDIFVLSFHLIQAEIRRREEHH